MEAFIGGIILIQEAIKSGKKFRRPTSTGWYNWDDLPYEWFAPAYKPFSKEDLLATDWEVEPDPPKKVEITLKDLENAWERTMVFYGGRNEFVNVSSCAYLFKSLAHELGLFKGEK